MIASMDNKYTVDTRSRGHWCSGRSGGGIFCGLMMLIIGVIWIGKTVGFIPLDMDLFWPSVMIIAGIWILATALLGSKRS